jgi:transposase InsO family protein
MNVHHNAKMTPRSRAEMIDRILKDHEPVAVVAADMGLSERSVYKWLARFRAEGLTGPRDRRSRPHGSPRTLHPVRVARILALRCRKLPGFQIARLTKVSTASVSRVLRRHRARLALLRPAPPVRRYEREAPGDLLHFDIKKLGRIARLGRRDGQSADHTPGAGWEYLHIAIDDHSRIAFAQLLPDETAQSAITFLHAALAFFQALGVRIQRIYSDNRSCYRSKAMRAVVAQLGLTHGFTRPYTPKTNGKAERFIQTSLREWAYAHPYPSSGAREERLLPFLHRYNRHRPHHSLKRLAPISRLSLTLNNLLTLHT